MGHEHEWEVYSTALGDGCIMVRCGCGALGHVPAGAWEQSDWDEAYRAPSEPYPLRKALVAAVVAPDTEVRRLREEVRRLRAEMTRMRQTLREKNIALDAMHWVWCDGGCNSGVHRYCWGEVTEEMVHVAERNAARLRRWYGSNSRRDSDRGGARPGGQA